MQCRYRIRRKEKRIMARDENVRIFQDTEKRVKEDPGLQEAVKHSVAEQVLIPEMNLGQLRMLVRSRYLVDAVGYNKVRGLPFKAEELADAIIGLLDEGVGK